MWRRCCQFAQAGGNLESCGAAYVMLLYHLLPPSAQIPTASAIRFSDSSNAVTKRIIHNLRDDGGAVTCCPQDP